MRRDARWSTNKSLGRKFNLPKCTRPSGPRFTGRLRSVASTSVNVKQIFCVQSTEKTNEIMFNTTIEEQKDLLLKYCGINFEDYYPAYYYKGIGLYRVPSIINKGNETITRHKWELNWELPFFITSHDFLQNIIISGKDIIRTSS